MRTPALARPEVTLDDKYAAGDGSVLLTGIQALVRLTLDQRRLDAGRGYDTGVLVSGYPGSPLGGVDRELGRERVRLEAAGVVFQPAVNEELAATAVGGTQHLGQVAGRRHVGVTGFWFGKNPGFDRAADAIRHSTTSGTAPLGGAVAWIGDDPGCKSSTVPSSCEPMCRSLALPLLAPGNVADVLSLGLHAVAMSRAAGLWTGLKIVADIADATATVDVGGARAAIPRLDPRPAERPPVLLPPTSLDAEEDLLTARLQKACEYARLTGLNRVAFEPRRPRLGVIAAGMSYEALERGCAAIGLDAFTLQRAGVRLIKLAMPWPLDSDTVRALVEGLETVLVVEDKLAFVETQVKEALYGISRAPLVLGKQDAEGRPLLPVRGAVAANDAAAALVRVIPEELLPGAATRYVNGAKLRVEAVAARTGELPRRTPYFCSGCPHNVSTKADDDQLVGVGIGCHIMVALDSGGRGTLLGMPQMGGEGAQWIGLAPFTEEPHFIQNLGDGTFHHSGSLAIRAAVAAGASITYRLLYNDAVAMTGGQRAPGYRDVPTITRLLAAEGVARTVITSPDPSTYDGVELAANAEVRDRDALAAVQRELAAVEGVTVLIHDDRCAAEKRRLRKRGKLPTPERRVWINERVCEGCGDCGEKSSCLSVIPTETEFGRKRRIHQSSCNQDFTCLKGDCPSFVVVTPGKRVAAPKPPALRVTLVDDPPRLVPDDVLIRMPGVGGTGVVTVSQILQMAAHLDGRHAAGLEQTGLAQKGGPVISDVRLASRPVSGQLRAATGEADVLLGFDLIGAAAASTLVVTDPRRTVAVLNTAVTPTAEMVTNKAAAPPHAERLVKRIAGSTRADALLRLDAEELAARLFGDHLQVNMLLVGVAFQHGCLPISAPAIERAIELNGASVERNLTALRWGRAFVVDRDAVERALTPREPQHQPSDPRARDIVVTSGAEGELRRLLELRVAELIAYQGVAYARTYAREVMDVAARAHESVAESDAATLAHGYARNLFKLMAYKDEYEVARLHLDSVERARRVAAFGPGSKARIMLHPPVLRALGLKRKIGFGPATEPLLRILRASRRLRGTPFDPFGLARVRRVERSLIGEYHGLVTRGLRELNPDNAAQVRELVELPEIVRGYEQIKLASVEEFRRRAGELAHALEGTEAK